MSDTKVIMPQMGESIFEGTITKWLKHEGDAVGRDEPLFEISTEKIDSEIPSPAAGVLKEIIVEEGQTVEINTVVAVIASDAVVAGDAGVAGNGEAGSEKGARGPEPAAPVRVEPSSSRAAEGAEPRRSGPGVRSSPMVRRLAREHGIDLAELAGRGTGAGGRLTKRDVLSYLEQRKEEMPAGGSGIDVERVPMSVMRRSIAKHMIESRRTSAHVATVFEVDCSAIEQARTRLKPEMAASGVHLTFTPFFVAAATRALGEFRILNSSVEADTIVYKKAIHVGIAVALEDGLIVPVIKNADKKDLRGLAEAVTDLGERARSGKLRPEDVADGTFTVTNPGQFGGLVGIPIINQPQVAILSVGAIAKRPVVVEDAIAIRPMAYLALSFDHRIIDGAVADQFMSRIKQVLEDWKDGSE